MSSALPDLKTQLSELIATPSVSCTSAALDMSNLPVVNKLAGWLECLGFDCEVMPVPGEQGKYNLIATLGSGPGGLVLAGHTDTVPYNAERWNFNPFKLIERDHRWHGLGTSDMKGFFPLAIEAAKTASEATLKQPLILLATADEESSMSGARALAEAGKPLARYAIVGEPTSLKPIRMHKGMMMESIQIQGESGHSSNPELGASALDAMHGVLTELNSFRKQLKNDYVNSEFSVAFPTMNFGCIHGGDNPNRICGSCELQIDLRPLPGMDLDTLRTDIVSKIGPIAASFGTQLKMESLFVGAPAHETAADSAIVKVAEQLTGHTAGSVNFGTEAPYLQQLGIDTLVLGPGDISVAHQPDEYISTESIRPTVKLLEQFIQLFCVEARYPL